MLIATVKKWGDDLVVILPPELRQELHLSEGSRLEMQPDQGGVKVRRSKYTLKELLDQCDFSLPMSDEDRAWDQMKPVGREII